MNPESRSKASVQYSPIVLYMKLRNCLEKITLTFFNRPTSIHASSKVISSLIHRNGILGVR